MSEAVNDARFLEIFPEWLRTLGSDAGALGDRLSTISIPGAASAQENASNDEGAKLIAAGLNYIFKSLDLIPDGIDDLGYMDDAFVLRVAAKLAVQEGMTGAPLDALAADAKQVEEFLGPNYEKLEAYVKNLRKGAARGRSVTDILSKSDVRTQFLQEVTAWSKGFEVPAFTRDVKTLAKLYAFLNAKL